MAEHREDAKPGDWVKVVRRARFNGVVPGVAGRIVKAVAFALATYADYDNGGDVRPGLARLAVECEIDYRTAKRCLAGIRDLGLVRLVQSGARRGHSDVYQLTLPEELLDRIDVLTPAQVDMEIERIRGAARRKPAVDGPPDGPGTGHSDPRTDDAVRVTPAPVQPVDNPAVRGTTDPVERPEPTDRTGHAVPVNGASTGHAVPQYGSRYAPLPSQSTKTKNFTETADSDLRTVVTVVGHPQAAQDQISPGRCRDPGCAKGYVLVDGGQRIERCPACHPTAAVA